MIKRQEPVSNIEKIFDFCERNYKKLKKIFILTFSCIFLLLFFRLSLWAIERYTFNRDLNRTVNQISQLVDNVRTTYAVHTTTKTDIMRLMANSNTLPDFMVKEGKLYNVYGGGIVVSSSAPVMEGSASLPTFKIAYQGLKKNVCMALAYLNWGGEQSGLISEALGYIDENGVDTALRDIEENQENQYVEVAGREGQMKLMVLPKRTLLNVAKPGDTLNPPPFSEVLAESGCDCGTRRACSFALRYYTYLRK